MCSGGRRRDCPVVKYPGASWAIACRNPRQAAQMEPVTRANGTTGAGSGSRKRRAPGVGAGGHNAGAGAGAGSGGAGARSTADGAGSGRAAVLERGSHPYGVQPLGNLWYAMTERGDGAGPRAGAPGATPKAARVVRTRDAGLGRLARLPDSVVQRVRRGPCLPCGAALLVHTRVWHSTHTFERQRRAYVCTTRDSRSVFAVCDGVRSATQVLECLDERALCRACCVSRSLYVFVHSGADLWKNLTLLAGLGDDFLFRASWKDTYVFVPVHASSGRPWQALGVAAPASVPASSPWSISVSALPLCPHRRFAGAWVAARARCSECSTSRTEGCEACARQRKHVEATALPAPHRPIKVRRAPL